MIIGKDRYIGKGRDVFIVAEAGINHNGNMDLAMEMIDKASEIGVDAIKFQTFFPEELFSKELNPEWFDLAKKWSFNKNQHLKLLQYSKKKGIEFFSTPVGKKSALLLKDIGTNVIKIASGELTNHELISYIATMKKPMIISTGLSNMSEIFSVVELMEKTKCPYALLHCNASYPSPIEDANLSTIPYFQTIFNVPIGYSDHTVGLESCFAAVALGATIIEKHFTLDKKMEGPDHKISADVEEFRELVSRIRIIEKSLGMVRTGPTRSEEKFRNTMRKSIAASSNIPNNTKIKKSMLTFIRPGSGIPPYLVNNLIGMTVKQNVKKGTLLQWNMF